MLSILGDVQRVDIRPDTLGRRRRPGRGLVALLVVSVLVSLLAMGAACTAAKSPSGDRSASEPPEVALTWSKIPLPGGAEPVTLTGSGSRLLVGARVATGRVRPRIFAMAPDTSLTQIPLQPDSPYSFSATWLSVAVDGNRILALGGAAGGAHANTRWTAWSGTTAGVAEQPQSFDTFGGYGAGSLLAAVVTSRGPALVGSWEGDQAGLDAAVWLQQGQRWVRHSSAGTALENTPELLVGPRSAAASGPRIVLPGSAVRLSAGQVAQRAAVWRSARLDQGWVRLDLPEAGRRSDAVSAGCTERSCVVAGYVDDRYALWSLSDDATARLTGLPELPVDEKSPVPAPLLDADGVLAVATTEGRGVVLAGRDRAWTRSPGPAGVPTASALVGDWLYVLSAPAGERSTLWRAPVAPLR